MLKFAQTGLLAPCDCAEDAEEAVAPEATPTVIVADF
jgi:hypothetical protein